jgi:hypothetical protein
MNYSFGQIVRSVAREVLSKCRILCGVAIVENAYDETAKIAAVASTEIEEREKELLKLARGWMPRLPFDRADLIFIDEMGKNISGTGMDTNVIGRKYNDHVAAPDEFPKIKRIAVRSLTPDTHGNATGIGMAEFCKCLVLKQIDVRKTRINCLTGGHPTAAMIPIDYVTDAEILDSALSTIGLIDPPDARVLWIKNTLQVAEVECSLAYYEEAKQRKDLTIVIPPREMPLDASGNLPARISDLKS